jgi:site-specific DNA recombinase
VWNRLRYVKNSETGTRTSRLNPPSEWTTTDVPELRIIDDALWQAVKARQSATSHLMRRSGIVRSRRPIHLFSGLTKCGVCGGGYHVSSRDTLRCFNHTARGTCVNTRAMTRQELETRVLRAIQEQLFAPGRFDTFCRLFADEMNRLRREHRAHLTAAPREIASINRRSKEILELLLQGFRDDAWKEELRDLEQRRTELQASLADAEAEPALPALHPSMAEVFQRKTSQLAAALRHDGEDERASARQACAASSTIS